MPPAGVIAVCALAAISYVFVGKPVVKATKATAHGVCKVATLGHKCKPKQAESMVKGSEL